MTRSTRSQVQRQRQHSRCSWRVASEAVAKGSGLDTVTVETMVQGPPPWTDCSKVHFWPDLDDMAPTPSDSSGTFSARLAAAKRALATFPPADLHLWMDGSAAANGDGVAGFALFIRGKLHLSQAHPVGQDVAELRTEAEAPSIYRHGPSSPLLATRLDQRSVRHDGSTAHGPFSIVGGLPAPHRTSRLSHLSTLQWC